MASSSLPQLKNNSLANTLSYFARYDYPLTYTEIRRWSSKPLPLAPSPGQRHEQSENLGEGWGEVQKKDGFYFLSGYQNPIHLRKQRAKFSKPKWLIARRVGDKLSKIPFIQAIFVTGALAMNNCPADDDIDLMIITSPHTLWLTRLLVYLNIHSFRRKPGVKIAPGLICDNLYLDANSLRLTANNLYTAHEILQAKCIFDRGGTHYGFLTANSWAKDYLPVAYSESLKNLKFNNLDLISNLKFKISNLLFPINLLLFWLQYLYMKPKMTTERVGLGYAFFHPQKK